MAANRIKGITIEIGGDTTKLQTALKGVNTDVRNARLTRYAAKINEITKQQGVVLQFNMDGVIREIAELVAVITRR